MMDCSGACWGAAASSRLRSAAPWFLPFNLAQPRGWAGRCCPAPSRSGFIPLKWTWAMLVKMQMTKNSRELRGTEDEAELSKVHARRKDAWIWPASHELGGNKPSPLAALCDFFPPVMICIQLSSPIWPVWFLITTRFWSVEMGLLARLSPVNWCSGSGISSPSPAKPTCLPLVRRRRQWSSTAFVWTNNEESSTVRPNKPEKNTSPTG